jgi:hypothetical protein
VAPGLLGIDAGWKSGTSVLAINALVVAIGAVKYKGRRGSTVRVEPCTKVCRRRDLVTKAA